MKKNGKISLNKTEESIFTLLSLYVLINQAFESLCGNEDIMNSNFEVNDHSFKDLVNDTIHEALVYQILLKTCAYIDEWNGIFGVKTDERDKEIIKLIKRIVRPAYKCISSWKELRDFRNQVIAHNHRDKNGQNVLLKRKIYNSPQSVEEIYLLIFCLEMITRVVTSYFPDMTDKVLGFLRSNMEKEVQTNFISRAEVLKKTKAIEEEIFNFVMKEKVISSVFSAAVNR
jgi:hypothetical protein